MKYIITIPFLILFFLVACTAERRSYYLYNADSYKGEPGLISSSPAFTITVADNSPISSLMKKYNGSGSSTPSHLNDYYLPPGMHTVTARGNSGKGMTIFGNFTFKVLIESGHHYVISCDDRKLDHAVVYMEDLTIGEKVGALQ